MIWLDDVNWSRVIELELQSFENGQMLLIQLFLNARDEMSMYVVE